MLNKTLLLDTKKINEEMIMGKLIEALPPTNDEFYIEHPKRKNAFTLKREDRRRKKAVTKGKKHVFKPKNWSK